MNRVGRAEQGGSTGWRTVVILCALAATQSGCGTPWIRSQRLPHAAAGKSVVTRDSVPIFPDRLLGMCLPAMHYIAGPFTPAGAVDQYQSTIRPPHSKFHPVPTRPVFNPPLVEPGPTLSLPPPTRAPSMEPTPAQPTGPPAPEIVPAPETTQGQTHPEDTNPDQQQRRLLAT